MLLAGANPPRCPISAALVSQLQPAEARRAYKFDARFAASLPRKPPFRFRPMPLKKSSGEGSGRGDSPNTLRDRILGCLLAGACGDALGAPVEYMSAAEIRAKYGPSGIHHFDNAYRHVGAITDDTQMTLFTVEGIIRAWVRQQLKGICHPPSVIHHSYLRWLETQEGDPAKRAKDIVLDGWLIKEQRLWSRRAPGNTCLSALKANRQFGAPALNDSKGCGAVMRAAPIGLANLLTRSLDKTFVMGVESAKVTHGHPSGYLSAGALAVIVAVAVEGRTATRR